MNKLGIITAAGKGRRFGGTYKELLPIGENTTMLSRAAGMLEPLVDTILVVTSQYKMAAHATALQGKPVKFAIQRSYEHDMWDAITETFDCAGDWNYFLMPDTWQPEGSLPKKPCTDFSLGLFITQKPERFGVLLDGQIADKDAALKGLHQAWGSVVWSKKVVEFWKSHPEIINYAQAFNMAIKEFSFDTYPINAYIDLASFRDYQELLAHI